MRAVIDLIVGDPQADRAVPHTGITARLTVFVTGVMAFLAVLVLALSMTAGRVADRWADELAQAATLRLPADAGEAAVARALEILRTTPGVATARTLNDAEQQALLDPWLGGDLSLDTLPIPKLIEIVADAPPYDVDGLRARFAAELPAAVLDDHAGWRAPLLKAAARLRLVAGMVTLLIGAALIATIILAAQASLAANLQVIRVLRLVGARDIYIARAFVRRFTLRAGLGAVLGVVFGVVVLQFVPGGDAPGSFLSEIGFQGAGWLWPLVIPLIAAIVAFAATRAAALARLKEQT